MGLHGPASIENLVGSGSGDDDNSGDGDGGSVVLLVMVIRFTRPS